MQQLVHCDHIICTICAISIAIYPALIDCMPLHCTHIAGVCCGGGRDGTYCVSAFLLLLGFFQLLFFCLFCCCWSVVFFFLFFFFFFFWGGILSFKEYNGILRTSVVPTLYSVIWELFVYNEDLQEEELFDLDS